MEHPHLRCEHHDAVDLLARQLAHRVADRLGRRVGEVQGRDRVPLLARRILDAGDGRGRTELPDRGGQDAQHVRLAGDQSAGGQVRPVVEHRDRIEDLGLRLRTDARMIVEHSGHRLMRDTGEPGDVADARQPRTLGGGGHHLPPRVCTVTSSLHYVWRRASVHHSNAVAARDGLCASTGSTTRFRRAAPERLSPAWHRGGVDTLLRGGRVIWSRRCGPGSTPSEISGLDLTDPEARFSAMVQLRLLVPQD